MTDSPRATDGAPEACRAADSSGGGSADYVGPEEVRRVVV
jgi:hypothetical protein